LAVRPGVWSGLITSESQSFNEESSSENLSRLPREETSRTSSRSANNNQSSSEEGLAQATSALRQLSPPAPEDSKKLAQLRDASGALPTMAPLPIRKETMETEMSRFLTKDKNKRQAASERNLSASWVLRAASTGCANWEDIQLARKSAESADDCGEHCSGTEGCVGFGFVRECENWKGMCVLWKGPGPCKGVHNKCWDDYTLHVHSPPATISTSEPKACGPWEEDTDYTGAPFRRLEGVLSMDMCCAQCSGDPRCKAWTWGKLRKLPGVSDVCFLKSGMGKKRKKKGIVSGVPSGEVRKHGFRSALRAQEQGIVARPWSEVERDIIFSPFQPCPGTFQVPGLGEVALTNAEWNIPGQRAGPVQLHSEGALVESNMKSRTYFTHTCTPGEYRPENYMALRLLGKTMRWTTNISGTGCGCNAAIYLTSMRWSQDASQCKDYYCDAASVCGVACAEIDLQEANKYAWASTLHASGDNHGPSQGYGGPRRDWSVRDYGPRSACIDTLEPFQVAASFPVDEQTGELASVDVEISQRGCRRSVRLAGYQFNGRDGMRELSVSLKQGMTPILSYWRSSEMLWMDGLGPRDGDGAGPCVQDSPDTCEDSVKFYDFSVESIAAESTLLT
jgi:hypothetical protein